MSDKLFIICLSSAVGFLVGKHIHGKYVKIRLYYDGLYDFSINLLQNLSFRQDNFLLFLEKFEIKTNKIFVVQLELLKKYLLGEELIVASECEKCNAVEIKDYFEKIGTVDLITQTEEVKEMIASADKMRKCAVENEKKKGETALKIGLLVGFGIGILII